VDDNLHVRLNAPNQYNAVLTETYAQFEDSRDQVLC